MSLTPRTIATLVAARTPGLWAHEQGLALAISKAGTAAWVCRYTAPDGRRRQMTLGAVDDTDAATLKAMQVLAAGLKQQARAGIDPLAARDGRKVEATARQKVDTFEEVARRYIAEQAPHWRSVPHREQWRVSLEMHAFPLIGTKAPHEIKTADVIAVLKQPYNETTFWDGARETASRVRMRIETILNSEYARNRDNPLQQDMWRDFRNPAQWQNHLQVVFKASAKRTRGHFEAMAVADLPAFFAELEERSDIAAAALRLTILCATRTSETLAASWSEFDLANQLWTIPASRTKANREHRIPLSDAAVTLLEALPRFEGNGHLFPGMKKGSNLHQMAMLHLLQAMRPDGNLTVHGMRSTFRDWAGETTLHPDMIVELALAHKVGDATVLAYRRSDALERRKKLMQHWADYILMAPTEYLQKWEKYVP